MMWLLIASVPTSSGQKRLTTYGSRRIEFKRRTRSVKERMLLTEKGNNVQSSYGGHSDRMMK